MNTLGVTVHYMLPGKIDLTDYFRLPNGLVFMFASFSLTSARKGYVPTFSTRICLLNLNS